MLGVNTIADELFFLSEYFEGTEKAFLLEVAESNDLEKIKHTIYCAEQILDGRNK